jgi:hypothetical protein
MDDELSAHKIDSEGDRPSNDEPGGGAATNGKNQITPAKREILINIAEIVGGFIFGGIAFALSDAGFHVLSFIFGFLSIGCGLVIIVHLIEQLGFKYPKTLLLIVLFLSAGLFGFLIWNDVSQIKILPHLSVAVMGKSSSDIWLTNDSIFIKGEYNSGDFRDALVVPVDPARRLAQLTFCFVNDAANTEAKSAQIFFITSNTFPIAAQPTGNINWTGADTGNMGGLQSLGILMPDTMPTDLIFQLPTLYFPNVENQIGKPVFTHLILQGTGIPRTELAFWMIFRVETNITYPQFVFSNKVTPKGTNGYFANFVLLDDVPTNR